MIEFKHKLPSMNIDNKHNGTYNNYELGFPSVLTTDDTKLGLFLRSLRNNINCERALIFVDGKVMMVNKNWIRDHVHVMKAFKHFEHDIDSFWNFIVDTQREDGQFYELVKQMDDYHWKFVNEDCRIFYPDDNLYLARLELEADVEYLVVEGAKYIYRVNGDIEWLRNVLPKLEKSIEYMTSDKKRWNEEMGLVIRPFTIDTWDFAYYEDKQRVGNDRRINPDTPMSIMHGDNSGVYDAMNTLAYFNEILGNCEKSEYWKARAEKLRENMFKYLWNGKFFMHQYHLGHKGLDNLESERLSLSNTYDMNRGVCNTEQCRSIINEYITRRENSKNFAEWFSIDPPYESFGRHTSGNYVNGAISPFTAGELAKAAFNNGFEDYGWDIIQRFMEMVKRDGDVFFLYWPDGTPQPEGGPSAWGSAALLSAVDEGLAGIVDMGVRYNKMDFSPRFPVTHYTELRYFTGYEKTKTVVDVKFILTSEGMRYDIYAPSREIDAHIMLPKGKHCSKLIINGEEHSFETSCISEYGYVDKKIYANGRYTSVEIIF